MPKKFDKRCIILNVSTRDFQNVMEILKQYSYILPKLYGNLYNAVIHKNRKDLKNNGFRYHYQCNETSTVLSMMSKEVRKGNKILARLKTFPLFLKNCVLPWKNSIVIDTFLVNVCLKNSHMI